MDLILKELLLEIFSKLENEDNGYNGDLIACSKTCKRWNSIVFAIEYDEYLWKPLVIKRFLMNDLILCERSWRIASIDANPSIFFFHYWNEGAETYHGMSCLFNVLPRSILEVTELRQIYFHNNMLRYIPKELSVLAKLEVLDLHGNKIVFVAPELSAMTSLRQLDLSINRLTSIPQEYSTLTNLKKLIISDNPITEFPSCVCHFSQLTELDVANLATAAIPPQISLLSKLIHLRIDRKQQEQVAHMMVIDIISNLGDRDDQVRIVVDPTKKTTDPPLFHF